MTQEEKRIADTVERHGEDDGVTKVLHAPSGLFMRKSGFRYDLLYVGLYDTPNNEREPRFYMVRMIDEVRESDTHTFFDWSELREELRGQLRTWLYSFEDSDKEG